MSTPDGRWTAEQVEALIVKVLHGQDHRGWSSCAADGDHEQSLWYTERAAAIREVLVAEALLQPPGGVNLTEYGYVPPSESRMLNLGHSPTTFAMHYATHSRPTVAWVGEGPNSDWPRFQGPWTPLSKEDS